MIFIDWLRWCSYVVIHVVTVDWETFTLKIIHMKNFRVIKFSWFRSIREIFLTVDDCSMDKRPESSWCLVYYQVSGEPGIACCSHWSDIYLGECGLACASFTDHRRIILFLCVLNFHSWSRPRNDFNSEIFPTYGTYTTRTCVVWLVETTHKWKLSIYGTSLGVASLPEGRGQDPCLVEPCAINTG